MRALLWLLCLFSLLGCSTVSRSLRSDGLEVITFTHENANAHLVRRGDVGFLFDSGYERNAGLLEADLRSVGFDPAKLKAIVIGHGHADHAGGANVFHARFGTPVVVGAGDEGMYESGTNEPLCPVGLIAASRKESDQNSKYTGSKPDVLVTEERTDLATLTGLAGTLRRLPGHTRGSLVVEVGDVVLVSDLFRGSIVGFGAETHFFMCDLEANRRDIAALVTSTTHARDFFVGHFGPVSPSAVREHFDVK